MMFAVLPQLRTSFGRQIKIDVVTLPGQSKQLVFAQLPQPLAAVQSFFLQKHQITAVQRQYRVNRSWFGKNGIALSLASAFCHLRQEGNNPQRPEYFQPPADA